MSNRILIVEDESEITKDLCDLFNLNGFESVGFTHAQESLDYLITNDIPIAVIDIVMPVPPAWDLIAADHGKKTGILLAKEMKKIRETIKIVAFTVVRDRGFLKEMREAGIEAIIFKPSVFDELLEAVKRTLK